MELMEKQVKNYRKSLVEANARAKGNRATDESK
jgi:hypothetical protein